MRIISDKLHIITINQQYLHFKLLDRVYMEFIFNINQFPSYYWIRFIYNINKFSVFTKDLLQRILIFICFHVFKS